VQEPLHGDSHGNRNDTARRQACCSKGQSPGGFPRAGAGPRPRNRPGLSSNLPSKSGAFAQDEPDPTGLRQRRILLITDAWAPQVNGVVRTLEALSAELVAMGHDVRIVSPQNQFTIPVPTYPEIRLAIFPRRAVEQSIREFAPEAIHIATEGTIGFAARSICLRGRRHFTTSFHTRFPEYVHARFPLVPKAAVYATLRRFHAPAIVTMVATPSLQRELEMHGFRHLAIWSRGVDNNLFAPSARGAFDAFGLYLDRPVFLHVGRLAVEKNIESFLSLHLPGTKLVVGDGPQRAELARRFPDALFVGRKTGRELAALYAASDVFVFPSRTDTFGLVLLEALASGTPIAAFPVPCTLDLLGASSVAALDDDLRTACLKALAIPRSACRAFAQTRSWRKSAEQFLNVLASTS
jgi:glycosyltransferase involved in cell wall biosynthesis